LLEPRGPDKKNCTCRYCKLHRKGLRREMFPEDAREARLEAQAEKQGKI
jgi:hypothetical protein